jgi:hypothetical protein
MPVDAVLVISVRVLEVIEPRRLFRAFIDVALRWRSSDVENFGFIGYRERSQIRKPIRARITRPITTISSVLKAVGPNKYSKIPAATKPTITYASKWVICVTVIIRVCPSSKKI